MTDSPESGRPGTRLAALSARLSRSPRPGRVSGGLPPNDARIGRGKRAWTGLRGWLLPPARYDDFLPRAQAITAREAAPLARVLTVTIAMMFIAMVAWSAIAEVEQVASSHGVVRPAGRVKVINHADGGRVKAILVSEGDAVTVDQILLELDPELTEEEIAKRTNEWHSLAADAARLDAEASGGTPTFDPELSAARPDLVVTQTQLFESRQRSLRSRRAAADRVVDERAGDAAALKARRRQVGNSLKILKQQEKAISKLAKKGYFPRLKFLSIKRQVSDLTGQVAETREAVRGANAALSGARSRRAAVDEEWRSETLARLAAARRERDRLKSSLTQEESRMRNLTIRAPTDGIVQNLAVTASGQAIRANEPLLRIVPIGSRLVIETRVSNDDIGHVMPGQLATIKLRAYDFVRFGTLAGIVDQVAPDATQDPATGQMLFTVTVLTDRAYLGAKPGERPVNPGMEAEVDFLIGKRSILSYLTDRLSRTTQSAFRER